MNLDLADYEEIRQLMARAALALDMGRGSDYADCYTPDGSFEVLGLPEGADHEGGHVGRTALIAFIDGLFAGTNGHCRHWNHNHVYTRETPGEVDVTSYLTVIRVGEVPQAGIILTCVYWDTLRKVDGRWLIHQRVCRADPQPEHAAGSTDILVVARDAAVAS